MSSSSTHNGQMPTDPATLIFILIALYLGINLLTDHQLAALGTATSLLSIAIPHLQRGGR